MKFPTRLLSSAWILLVLAAAAWIARTASANLARAERVSNLGGGDVVAADPASATGYAGGVRKLILPEFDAAALQWVAHTQRQRAHGEWRLRHVDDENAPVGRAVHAPSPYRWWLALVSWCDERIAGRPAGQAVERAALLAGPALQVLLLLGAAAFAARYFGAVAAGGVALGVLLLFPGAADFGAPAAADRTLTLFLGTWALLPLAAASLAPERAGARARLLAVAGLAGGLGLWVDSGSFVLLLAALAAGAVAAMWLARGTDAVQLPWRTWARVGAVTSLAAYVLEYAPSHLLGWRLEWNHPLHALAWLGAGEILHAARAWIQDGRRPAGARAWVVLGLAMAATAALPVVAALREAPGLLGSTTRFARLSLLPGSGEAADIVDWMVRAPAGQLVALLLPWLLVLPAGWAAWRRPGAAPVVAWLLAAGMLVAAAGWFLPGLFALHGVVWVVLTAVLLGRHAPVLERGFTLLLAGAAFAAGALVVVGTARTATRDELTASEVEALVQRDLAYWLAQRNGETRAVVLAPPTLTSALNFYGGLRGLGTLDPENQDGFAAAVRICAASSTDEAEALARKREVTHVIVPSWDSFLDEYARLGSSQPQHTLVALLRQWLPPRWLHPVPYSLPQVEGLGERSLAIFEVGEVQDAVNALSRLAEYFVETERMQEAAQVAYVLEQRFAEENTARIARAVVAVALGRPGDLQRVMRDLRPALDRGEDADLPWDRRTTLAILLAQARLPDLAKPRIAECVAGLDEDRLRQLSTSTLYRLLVLAKAFDAPIDDPALREKARRLLPPELRARL